ncbi:MAG: biopolymer transporter ExbD [bacterium]|nr:biopolymer transporter ExbD [Gammaproteobacteria bacterium]HIL84392.1 biopolymer transporter ExbD [Pseudomonadales bacterium]
MKIDSQRKKFVRRISLTPLADLVFILLVFFILETSFLRYREISLNPVTSESAGDSAGNLLSIELFAQGSLWVQGEVVNLNNFNRYLDDKHFNESMAVSIALQEKVTLQLLVDVMDQLKSHGLVRIQISSLIDEDAH